MGPEGFLLKFSENDYDKWLLHKTNFKRQGFFVDIGAGDGIIGSNTFLLEKFYNWQGICVDPNPTFLKSLCGSRDCLISDLAVYKQSGKVLPFKHLQQHRTEFIGWHFRSGLAENVDKTSIQFDDHRVYSITLNDLLELYAAPKEIDYISIDTEGSEVDILGNFDFDKYNIKFFTIESNNEENRNKVIDIMSKNKYNIIEDLESKEDRFEKQLNN
jgi:FkbM family methyltransferase